MKMPAEMNITMIAPCGVNCSVCSGHLRVKKHCPGCRMEGPEKPTYCRTCKMKVCADSRGAVRCAECASFPCARLKRLDRRYRLRYGVPLVEDGRRLLAEGVEAYMQAERARWACPACGGVISMHKQACIECGLGTGFTPPSGRL
jgi:hypothetical protein